MEVNEVDYFKIGRRIREYRKRLGLQQMELAGAVGVTPSHMSHIETGQTKGANARPFATHHNALDIDMYLRIANELSVSVDDLICDNLEQVKVVYDKKIAEALADCNAAELEAFYEIIITTKTVIRSNVGKTI